MWCIPEADVAKGKVHGGFPAPQVIDRRHGEKMEEKDMKILTLKSTTRDTAIAGIERPLVQQFKTVGLGNLGTANLLSCR